MSVRVATRRGPAFWVALAVGVVMAGLVGVLFTRESAETRLVDSPLVGKVAPDTLDIDQQRGRWVLVNFFATWCEPCQREHDDLVRFAAAHPDDARVVSVVFDDDADAVEQFFDQRGGDWPVAHDDDGAIATAWGVVGVPESYLVAPNGRVLGKVIGGVTFRFLQEQLARFTSP